MTHPYQAPFPPRAPFCGLGAICELAAELTEITRLANKELIDNKGITHRLCRLFKPSKLPIILERFAARMRKLAQRAQGENLFFDNDGKPLDVHRVDLTYETLLRPLINISYILGNGAVMPPRGVNKEMMTFAITKLVYVVNDLGEGLRSDIGHQVYHRTLHTITRLEQAERAWRKSAESEK